MADAPCPGQRPRLPHCTTVRSSTRRHFCGPTGYSPPPGALLLDAQLHPPTLLQHLRFTPRELELRPASHHRELRSRHPRALQLHRHRLRPPGAPLLVLVRLRVALDLQLQPPVLLRPQELRGFHQHLLKQALHLSTAGLEINPRRRELAPRVLRRPRHHNLPHHREPHESVVLGALQPAALRPQPAQGHPGLLQPPGHRLRPGLVDPLVLRALPVALHTYGDLLVPQARLPDFGQHAGHLRIPRVHSTLVVLKIQPVRGEVPVHVLHHVVHGGLGGGGAGRGRLGPGPGGRLLRGLLGGRAVPGA
mmetsp:Transcript_40577/g.106599  ORF Transcript_40577/g.106599 Transcript_40577/m.106599 type:complete len:306 (-) Transcript_40577:1159-2076(-)